MTQFLNQSNRGLSAFKLHNNYNNWRANIGRIEQHDGSSDPEEYLECLEMYFVANDVATVGISGADEACAGGCSGRR